jgi:hypothetical protein
MKRLLQTLAHTAPTHAHMRTHTTHTHKCYTYSSHNLSRANVEHAHQRQTVCGQWGWVNMHFIIIDLHRGSAYLLKVHFNSTSSSSAVEIPKYTLFGDFSRVVLRVTIPLLLLMPGCDKDQWSFQTRQRYVAWVGVTLILRRFSVFSGDPRSFTMRVPRTGVAVT